jgi:hypothetical protein
MPSKRTQKERSARYRKRMAEHGFVAISVTVPKDKAEEFKAAAQAMRDGYFKLELFPDMRAAND